MSMTARELWEIVKDVPRDAWPYQMMFHARRQMFTNEIEPSPRWDVTEDWAEHAFIGSMTAWLAAKQKYPTHAIYKDNALFEDHAMVSVNNRQIAYRQPSLVAALAAACKEAA